MQPTAATEAPTRRRGGEEVLLPARRLTDQLAGRHRPRGRAGAPPLLVVVGALCFADSQLGNERALRKLVLLLPVVTLLAAVAHLRARRQPSPRGRLPVGLVLYAGWVAASVLWTTDAHDTAHQVVEYLCYGTVGVILAAVLDSADLVRVFALATKWFVAATAAMLLVAYHAATHPAVDDAPGWHGPFGHKNSLGFLMATGLVALVLERPRRRFQRCWVAAAAALLLGSQSGAGLAVTLVLAAVGTWAFAVRELRSVGQRLLFKLLSVSAALVGAVVLVTDFPAAVHLLGKNPTLTGRTRIWVSVVHGIAEQPVHGWGFGGVWLNTAGETARLWQAIGFHAFEAHDAYLDLLLQVGVVGAVLLLLPLGAALVRSGRRLVGGTPADRWVALVLVAFVIEAVVESVFLGDGLLLLAALITASLGGARRSSRPDRRDLLLGAGPP